MRDDSLKWNAKTSEDRLTIQRMVLRFILSVTLLAVTVAGNYILIEYRISTSKIISSVLDNVGQQRMLAERIILFSQMLIDSPAEANRERFRKEILGLVQAMQKVHEDQIRSELSSKPSVSLEPPFHLGEEVKGFLSSFQSLAEAPGEYLTSANPHFNYFHSLAHNGLMVSKLNQAIGYYQKQRDVDILRNIRLGRLQLGLFLLMIACLAVAVFWPMARQIRGELDNLEKMNIMLDLHAQELSQSNKKMKDKEGTLVEIMEHLTIQKRSLQNEIARRVEAEKALEKERNIAQKYFEIAGVILVVIDGSENVKRINRRGCQILGYSEEEIIGKNWFDHFLPPKQRSDLKALFNQVISGHTKSPEYFETALLTRGGAERIIAWHNTLIKNDEGAIVATLSSGEDVTDQKLSVERQMNLLEKLEKANCELNDFAYVVSHDLKAPLRGIGSLANWLLSDYSDKIDDQGKESLNLLVGRVKRMHNLIDGLLQFAKVGRIDGEITNIDLNRLVGEVVDLIAPSATIKVTIDRHLPTIRFSPTRMQQIFQNLISNSVKYMNKPTGDIRIGFSEQDSCWQFYVEDNGPGIDKKHFEKIFHIFQTLAPRDSFESTGIGLALVKKIVETNGGQIWVESELGSGTTFFFTIPKTGSLGKIHEHQESHSAC